VFELLLHVSKRLGRPGRLPSARCRGPKVSKISNPIPWPQDSAGTDTKLTLIADSKTSVTLPFDPAPEIWTLLPWNWRGERNIFEP
jgi:hypothetical protein